MSPTTFTAANCRRSRASPLSRLGEAWERRVHARCRAALGQQPRSGGVAPRLLDAALVVAIGLYLASVVTEAVRLVAAG